MSDISEDGWGVFETDDGEIHISPVDEDHVHDGSICRCLPMQEMQLFVHNSFDGREMPEQAEKFL